VIGKILGNRYRILREVGSGGMAWVYLAEDVNEGRLVAVKVLYPQFNEDLAYIQRFNREAKLASILSDPHIVSVLDYGATRDVHYLVMEYIEGQDLRVVIDERGSLSWREALQILDQMAVALEHAHLHGIVHRDIKPQNLMVTSDGVLKVLDFGIARARMLPSLTQSGFVGSPYYISPEQAMGEDVDIRSDIYSSGVVFYEMLSGRVPYDAASPWSIINQHIASEPPRIELRGNDIPESSETLLNGMIAKRPEDRFQTPTALRQAIDCVLEGRPLAELLDIRLRKHLDLVVDHTSLKILHVRLIVMLPSNF
jgi:serine/threonine-protein kinase